MQTDADGHCFIVACPSVPLGGAVSPAGAVILGHALRWLACSVLVV